MSLIEAKILVKGNSVVIQGVKRHPTQTFPAFLLDSGFGVFSSLDHEPIAYFVDKIMIGENSGDISRPIITWNNKEKAIDWATRINGAFKELNYQYQLGNIKDA